MLQGNSLDLLPTLEANSIDSIVTDPPYELGFQNKKWDSSGISYNIELWQQCLRVLKPGGHLLSFGGTRTWHRIAVAIEDAGFEIRDSIAWLYGSGFPKSHNLKGEWEGWGTALKPAFEPIVFARKPITKTVAENVSQFRTGAINIKVSRIGDEVISVHNAPKGTFAGGELNRGSDTASYREHIGRWPANVILDEIAAEEVDNQTDIVASRFFYIAKAGKKERSEGLNIVNNHPTVKPTALMEYLIKLVTPPGGIVLDPFTGSGSTGKAAILNGFEFIGIELTEEYLPIIEGRLKHAEEEKKKKEALEVLKQFEGLF